MHHFRHMYLVVKIEVKQLLVVFHLYFDNVKFEQLG